MKYLISMFFTSAIFAQSSYLNIGINGHGLCFGNPTYHNGINLSMISRTKIANGLSIGLFAALDSCSNGVKVSCFGSDAGYHNGLVIAGLNIIGKKINGSGIALWTVSADTMNGAFFAINGGVAKWSSRDTINLINGAAIAATDVSSKKMNGFSFSFGFNLFDTINGVSISLVNRAKVLRGVQFGLINYVAGNRKIFRWMPFVNFNFKIREKHPVYSN